MTEKQKTALYEGMYIISSTLSEEARKKALERITQGIDERGGEVVKVHDRGRRRLAYPIDGHREGHYYVLNFQVKPDAISEMWHDYHLNEDLIRFMTLKAEQVRETIEFKPLAEQA